MFTKRFIARGLAAIVTMVGSSFSMVLAQDSDIFAQYREMFGDDNPADLVSWDGEDLWSEARGPKGVSLEECDLGLGPGELEGAYAQLPRYFADAERVMDLETRLIYCMVELQGLDENDILAKPFTSRGEPQTDLEKLAAFISSQSQGVPVAVNLNEPHTKAAYDLGKKMFFFRAGPYDFGCSTCHQQDGKRIRLQSLPQLSPGAEDANRVYTSWPAYRISEGAVRTFGWRMRDCARQQRLPEMVLGSEISTGLITYLAAEANGGEMEAPGLKR